MARILVVDDEPMVRDLLRTILGRLKHDVAAASDGQGAITRYRQQLPNLLILDLNLPDINGIEVLRRIREIDADVPVIVLTGGGSEALEQQARALGVKYFLQKGFSLDGIGEALRRVLRQPVNAGAA
ncbi:MAG: response regulator [Nitrospiraceae bacterium]